MPGERAREAHSEYPGEERKNTKEEGEAFLFYPQGRMLATGQKLERHLS